MSTFGSMWSALLGVPSENPARLLVGTEDEPDGGMRVYVDHRATGIHVHLPPTEHETIARLRHWRAHTFIEGIPSDALCDCTGKAAPCE